MTFDMYFEQVFLKKQLTENIFDRRELQKKSQELDSNVSYFEEKMRVLTVAIVVVTVVFIAIVIALF